MGEKINYYKNAEKGDRKKRCRTAEFAQKQMLLRLRTERAFLAVSATPKFAPRGLAQKTKTHRVKGLPLTQREGKFGGRKKRI